MSQGHSTRVRTTPYKLSSTSVHIIRGITSTIFPQLLINQHTNHRSFQCCTMLFNRAGVLSLLVSMFIIIPLLRSHKTYLFVVSGCRLSTDSAYRRTKWSQLTSTLYPSPRRNAQSRFATHSLYRVDSPEYQKCGADDMRLGINLEAGNEEEHSTRGVEVRIHMRRTHLKSHSPDGCFRNPGRGLTWY